jgi:transposase
MAKRRTFSPEFKARVVLEVLTGEKTSADICREHRVSAQQLSNWKKQFVDNAPVVFENGKGKGEEEQQIAELERMVGKLTMQLEIAKKASAIVRSHQAGNGR